jgi:hypothetical protein
MIVGKRKNTAVVVIMHVNNDIKTSGFPFPLQFKSKPHDEVQFSPLPRSIHPCMFYPQMKRETIRNTLGNPQKMPSMASQIPQNSNNPWMS